MTKKRMSHTECDHENTKVARARCRRERSKMNLEAPTAAPVEMEPTNVVTPADEPTNVEEPTDEELSELDEYENADDFDQDELDRLAEEAADVVKITRENWREFKGRTDAKIDLTDGVTDYEGEVTGWSEKNLQFRDVVTGKTKRLPVADVSDVFVIDYPA